MRERWGEPHARFALGLASHALRARAERWNDDDANGGARRCVALRLGSSGGDGGGHEVSTGVLHEDLAS